MPSNDTPHTTTQATTQATAQATAQATVTAATQAAADTIGANGLVRTVSHTVTRVVPRRFLATSAVVVGLAVTGLAPTVGITATGTTGTTGTAAAGAVAPLASAGVAASDLSAVSASTGVLAGRTIVLDPAASKAGLGKASRKSVAGCDRAGRVTRNGMAEATVTLRTAKKLGAKLTKAGARVLYTRTGSGAVCADARASVANTAGAALKISIETSNSRNGVSVLAPKKSASIYSASRAVATKARDSVKAKNLPRAGKGLKYTGSVQSLNLSAVPAIAVSAGNTANLADARRMTSGAGQKALASALASAAEKALTGAGASSAPSAAAGGAALGVQVFSMWRDNDINIQAMDAVVAAGSHWIRVDVGWCSLEEAGSGRISAWYQQRLDATVAAARARGLNMLMMVACSPTWAAPGGNTAAMPTNPAEFARVMGYLAARYRGQVAAWELWNEPDCQGGCPNGSAEEYATLLKAAYPATKAADPAATVMNGGLSGIDLNWIRRLFAAGAGNSLDALALHPYLSPATAGPETPAVAGYTNPYRMTNISAAHDLVTSMGRPNLPIWFTEFGWTTGRTPGAYDGVSAQTQADYLTASMAMVRTKYPYVTNAFWYMLRDRVDNNAYENGFGLFNADMTPKPAYTAFTNANH